MREKITQQFISLMEDKELRSLMEEALRKAHEINPNKITNPASNLEEFYDFIDWACKCMPWNVLKDADYGDNLYLSIDQSLNYFWFVFGQELDDLKDKGYYFPCLEYHEPIASWIKDFSKDWGHFLSTEESWNDDYYQKQFEGGHFGMDKGWYGDKNIWKTYNDFFSRKLIDPSVRPIGNAPLTSPADCRIEGVWKIKDDGFIDDGVIIKSHKFYTVDDLLGEESKYHGTFNGGTLTHAFLNVNDYHRYHFPIDGKILEMTKIDAYNAAGGFATYDKDSGHYLFNCSDTSWQAKETRDCIILDTEYGIVAVLPVGMSQVCSCNFEENLKVGDYVKKGDPLGYFLFGGSDIVILLEKKVEFTLLKETGKHIYMGEDYAYLKI